MDKLKQRQQYWLGQIEEMIAQSDHASQEKFLRSVKSQIVIDPCKPTESQVVILRRLQKHYAHNELRETLGDTLDCFAV